uniref:Uncharacterized protein n=1 Tax=Populus trichocarpa TaxID=3694 RepID=A0A2K1X833_POPTR
MNRSLTAYTSSLQQVDHIPHYHYQNPTNITSLKQNQKGISSNSSNPRSLSSLLKSYLYFSNNSSLIWDF